MSWHFDRPDLPDLESHSGCRASGPDGRYFPPPEVTPLIVVLQVGLPYSSSWKNLHLKDLGRVPEVSRRWRIRYPASAGHPKRRSAPVERRR